MFPLVEKGELENAAARFFGSRAPCQKPRREFRRDCTVNHRSHRCLSQRLCLLLHTTSRISDIAISWTFRTDALPVGKAISRTEKVFSHQTTSHHTALKSVSSPCLEADRQRVLVVSGWAVGLVWLRQRSSIEIFLKVQVSLAQLLEPHHKCFSDWRFLSNI